MPYLSNSHVKHKGILHVRLANVGSPIENSQGNFALSKVFFVYIYLFEINYFKTKRLYKMCYFKRLNYDKGFPLKKDKIKDKHISKLTQNIDIIILLSFLDLSSTDLAPTISFSRVIAS